MSRMAAVLFAAVALTVLAPAPASAESLCSIAERNGVPVRDCDERDPLGTAWATLFGCEGVLPISCPGPDPW